MRIAIMQPYLFPYLGYFQLFNAVDKFIVYDDVAFIKQGWINRNFILSGNQPLLFTVPLEKISSNKLIKDTQLDKRSYANWQNKFFRTLAHAYSNAPYFEQIFPLLKNVFNTTSDSLSCILMRSLLSVAEYLEVTTQVAIASDMYANQQLKGQERILDICRLEGATAYYNLIGGRELYKKNDFLSASVILNFLKTRDGLVYAQGRNQQFVPNLSIIDVLMFNSKEKTQLLLQEYDLV